MEIGADGPSQMGLEDIAAPTAAMLDLPGVSYLRTTRGGYPVLYPAGEEFPVGGA